MSDRDGAAAYGDAWAEVYDDEHQFMDPTAAVAVLAELAGSRPVLELGVGTGRIALPLQERGIEVRGVDASSAMVDRMRDKPGGASINVGIGDMASMALGGNP